MSVVFKMNILISSVKWNIIRDQINTTTMNTNLTTHIYARASRANAAGLFPIYIRITLNGKRGEFTTKKYIHLAKWDEKAMRVKGNTEEARTINSYLESIRNKIIQIQIHLQFQEDEITIDHFMSLLIGKKT